MTMVGGLSDLRSLVLFWHSEGTVHFQRLESGLFAVTFVGSHYLELDRDELARTNVHITFRGGNTFAGGVAMLHIGAADPVQLPSERVPLPMGRLAAVPEIHGPALSLEVVGTRLQHARIGATYGRERVTLIQVER